MAASLLLVYDLVLLALLLHDPHGFFHHVSGRAVVMDWTFPVLGPLFAWFGTVQLLRARREIGERRY